MAELLDEMFLFDYRLGPLWGGYKPKNPKEKESGKTKEGAKFSAMKDIDRG